MNINITKTNKRYGWSISDSALCNFGHSHELPICELLDWFSSEKEAQQDAERMIMLIKQEAI